MEQSELWFMLTAGAGAVLAAFRHRLRSGAASPGTTRSAQQAGGFHAVAVRTRSDSCSAAQLLEGTRFLSREAPQLPLPACTNGVCNCVYQHFCDRRRGERRDAFMADAYAEGELKNDRRRAAGRRLGDR